MGMTIDDSIMELEILKKNTFSYMSAHQAFITAIETMRKYQKIDEIVEHWACCGNPSDSMIAISEVLDNGNDD